MDNAGLSKLLLSLTSDEPELVERSAGVSTPTPNCLPLSRIRSAVLRESWSEQEAHHLSSCTYCSSSELQARTLVWHPSLVHLFWHARNLLHDDDRDVKHHLQRDSCRRCLRLGAILGADRILARLAGQIRQGIASAANRLGRALASGAVASFAFAASAPGDLRLSFEDGKHSLLLSHADPARLRLEAPASAGAEPQLFRVLIGDQQGGWDHLVVPRPATDPALRLAEVRLAVSPSSRVSLAFYPVDASLLHRDDAVPLHAAFAAACKLDPMASRAWQTWARLALQRGDLDAVMRPALEAFARPDAGKSMS